jgi:acetyltransferase-like isoleucine patch superfamily enzyme/DNA-binding phage protein
VTDEDLVRVLLLDEDVEEELVAQARKDLERLPGVGAVVVDDGAAVVTYRHLLDKASTPHLQPLLRVLAAKSYAVVDQNLEPWEPPTPRRALAPLRAVVRRSRNAATVAPHVRVLSARRRWWRIRFVARLRWEAWLRGTDLELRVSKDLYVEPGTRFDLGPVKAVLEIGPRCRILSGVLFRLRGELLMGPGCELRQDISINVKGRLRFSGRNTLGKGAMIHADAEMLWEWGACVADYVTVLDSHHDLDGSLVQMLDQGVTAAPITMGAACFVGSKGSVMPGVRMGRASVAAAGAVVTKDVPDGAIAAGVPATVIRHR